MRDNRIKQNTCLAWCSLVRLPNLLTVPGDPIAGAILASATSGTLLNWNAIRSCALASLCLYTAGLLANDFIDRKQDACDRPERPLPTGAVAPGPVLVGAVLLTVGAIFFAALSGGPTTVIACILALLSWSYNLGLKRIAVIGPVAMGSCRASSLLLGAAGTSPDAIFSSSVVIPALVLGLLIASITTLARHETESIPLPFWQTALPPVILLTGLSSLIFITPSPSVAIHHPPSPFSLLLATMPILWITLLCAQLAGSPAPSLVQRNIGGMIRGLILLQAAICASAGSIGSSTALAILAAFPVSGWLGKCFQGS